ADDHSLGLFPSPRRAAAAITTTRPGSAHGQSSGWPISLDSIATRRGRQRGGGSTWITRKGLRPEGWPRPFVIDATAASFLLILHYRGLHEGRLTLDWRLEREFGTRKYADSHRTILRRGESSCAGAEVVPIPATPLRSFARSTKARFTPIMTRSSSQMARSCC